MIAEIILLGINLDLNINFPVNTSNVVDFLQQSYFNSPLSQSMNNSPVSICLENETLFLEAETADFWLYICGDKLPQFYLSIRKKTSEKIRFPLSRYSQKEFVVNQPGSGRWGGIYVYTLTPLFWEISYYGKIILSQKVLSWYPLQDLN